MLPNFIFYRAVRSASRAAAFCRRRESVGYGLTETPNRAKFSPYFRNKLLTFHR